MCSYFFNFYKDRMDDVLYAAFITPTLLMGDCKKAELNSFCAMRMLICLTVGVILAKIGWSELLADWWGSSARKQAKGPKEIPPGACCSGAMRRQIIGRV